MMAFLCSGFSRAQLAPGSHAYDFTVTDQFGIQHNLYSYLDQGFTVILCVDATWVGPSWSYHQSGTLNQLYTEHGPAGHPGVSANTTNDVQVIWVDGDENTSDASIIGQTVTFNGQSIPSQGNWLLNPNTGEPLNYAICNPTGSSLNEIFSNYAIGYFPTIYQICPDRSASEIGQISSTEAYSGINCSMPSLSSDIKFTTQYNGSTTTCGSLDLGTVIIKNYGIDVLTSCTINIAGNALTSPINIPWNGLIAPLQIAEVNLGETDLMQTGNINISIEADANPSNSIITQTLTKVTTPSTTKVKVRIQFDNYPEECSWTIKNDLGTTIFSKDYSTNTPADLSTVEEIVDLPNLGCYYFVINDAYGDGLHGSQWTTSGNTGNDGNISVTTLNAANNNYSTIWNYNGSSDYSSITFAINASLTPTAAGTGSGNSQIGCTNPQACNYNASATQDNGSCILPQTEICDNVDNNCNGVIDDNCAFVNFNSLTCDSAINLDNTQIIYPDTIVNLSAGILNQYYEQGIFINPPSDAGLLDPQYSGYNISSYSIESITYNNGLPVSNLGLESSCSIANCIFPSGQQNCITISGTPNQSGIFSIEINTTITIMMFGFPVPVDYRYVGYKILVVDSLFNPLYGCTNPQACNYNPAANQDNGTCLVLGNSCNDNQTSTINDVVNDSCICAGTPTDLNGNNENTYQGLYYQAVARNADGTPMANQDINLRFSLHQSTATGAIEYQEVQNVNSNALGLFTTYFGTGQASVGNFNNIQWGVNAKYLQVEMYTTNWQTLGTQQLAAVPYAIRAKQVEPNGLKLQSPNGNCYILQVNNAGQLSTIAVPCD